MMQNDADTLHEEENRLLYALTRARDGLAIGGWEAPYRYHERKRLSDHCRCRCGHGRLHDADGILQYVSTVETQARPSLKTSRQPRLWNLRPRTWYRLRLPNASTASVAPVPARCQHDGGDGPALSWPRHRR